MFTIELTNTKHYTIINLLIPSLTSDFTLTSVFRNVLRKYWPLLDLISNHHRFQRLHFNYHVSFVCMNIFMFRAMILI